MSNAKPLFEVGKPSTVVLRGILGNNCGLVERYEGTDKRLQEKGFVVRDGIPALRGYAKISDLAAISHARYSDYQRKEDQSHVENIRTFLNEGKAEAKFLPEVVLSIDKPENVVLTKFNHKSFSSLSQMAKGAIENLEYYSLTVTKESLSRVDGNHRLEAGVGTDYYVPFSVILWNIDLTSEENMLPPELNQKNVESEAFLFYVLNNKARKLQLEENYKGLVKSENWTDNELAKIDRALPLLKRFKNKWLSSDIFYCPYLDQNPLAQMGKVINEIYDSKPEIEIDNDTFDILIQETIDILKQRSELCYIKNKLSDIVAQLVFYAVYNKVEDEEPTYTLSKINQWCERYKYSDNVFTSAKKLYDISVKQIRKKKVFVFVAMPYYSVETVGHYNDIFSSACTKIIEDGSNVDIETYPIMSFKGKTFDIEEDIMDKIDKCDIFVADISKSNPNVMYELGMAAKAGKPIIIIKKKLDKAKTPSDIVLKFRVEFSECMDLKNPIYEHLKAILKEDFLAVFTK